MMKNYFSQLIVAFLLFTSIGQAQLFQDPTPVDCDNSQFEWSDVLLFSIPAKDEIIHDTGVELIRFGKKTFTQFRVPGPYPAEFSGPVTISIDEWRAYDASKGRGGVNYNPQPNERFKIVFLNNGTVVGETAYTTDLRETLVVLTIDFIGMNYQVLFLRYFFLTDLLIFSLVHYEDDQFGEGSENSPNSVYPTGLCISFEADVCELEANASGEDTICEGESVELSATGPGAVM